ncbi:phage holin family protein [Paenibacillus paeoniae]|uniref:phage holin family protein n=1 Tax=Paenibacillus paeoniae TaxID=2292705 RepID=UPI00140357F0|nr:phage holin family protein [Paenibacillus paeoniae]
MERIDLIVKAIVGFAAGLFSIITSHFGIFFAVLFVIMLLDFISGIFTAIYTGEKLNSKKGFKGLFKKAHTLILIGCVALIEIYVLKSNGVFTDGISGVFILMEFVSIVENGRAIGKLPVAFDKFISIMKNKVGESEDHHIHPDEQIKKG